MSGPFDFDDGDDYDYQPSEHVEDEELIDEEELIEEEEEEEPAEETDDLLSESGPTSVLLQTLLANVGTGAIDLRALQAYLRRGGGRIVVRRRDDDDDDDENYYYSGSSSARKWFPDVTEPQEAGDDLLKGGEFGRIEPILEKQRKNPLSLGQKIRAQRLNPRRVIRETVARSLVPNTCGTIVAKYDANPYSGQYSADSSFYYTCVQDFRLHIYDTSAPTLTHGNDVEPTEEPGHLTSMKTMKTINGAAGNWTITDSHLSPDNERMIYSSITTTVHMTKTRDATNEQIPIQLSDRRGTGAWAYGDNFGIYSCRFSADGKEIVAGGSGNLFVYDLQAMRRTVRIPAHEDDVNSCCWADSSSGNVLISASDDTFLKVWDRRSLGAHATPAGVLVGHTEGITYVSPKGDGRYVVSNGKDQTMRLWDLRKMRSHSEWEAMPRRNYGLGGSWDYRSGTYRKPRFDAHPENCSVMAYRGHHVLKTLIRCHFSPEETTGGSYLYTGSADGQIHVYSLDGRIVQVLDRSKALPISYDPSESEPSLRTRPRQERERGYQYMAYGSRQGVVRDVSWHSHEPVLMSVAWGAGGGDNGTVAKHEWKGLGKNGMTLEDVVERDSQEQPEQRIPGGFPSD